MSGHTPEPWSLIESEKTWQCRYQINSRDGLCVVALEQSPLHDAEANARLIAAAPELLVTLQEIVRQHKNIRVAESYPTPNSDATDDADAAIAKATGEIA